VAQPGIRSIPPFHQRGAYATQSPATFDPSGSGDYTIRLWFPDGYQFPVHWHPTAEHVTVLSGTLLLGMGKQANASALNTYQPGDFLYLPAKNTHFGGAKGATVIQLHGMGPFAVYVGTP
jgi:quercetin dioxygenase-like cupin family protein